MRERVINEYDDAEPVMVPRSDRELVPMETARARRLREHLIKQLHDLRQTSHLQSLASRARPETGGFAARVAQTACSLCKGWCCRNGGDDGFLDDRTLARVRLTRPEMTEQRIVRLYLDCVPHASYRDSCIFHGSGGCTLDRAIRADVCNSYFCGGLSAFLKSAGPAAPAVVIAGERDNLRTSPVLVP